MTDEEKKSSIRYWVSFFFDVVALLGESTLTLREYLQGIVSTWSGNNDEYVDYGENLGRRSNED